jgi:UDP-glucose 4-epimerase
MKILVIGGNGYLGANLCNYLAKSGNEVIAGIRTIKKNKNLLQNRNNLAIHWDNIFSNIESYIGFDIFIYAAGLNSSDSKIDPVLADEVNGEMPLNFIKLANRAGVKNFIYVSTAHVYSNNMSGKISETDSTTNKHKYAQSHLLGEENILSFSKLNKMHSLVVRLSNCYGAPQSINEQCWNLVMNELCYQAVSKKIIKLKTSGAQRRNFISMRETSLAINFLIQNLGKSVNNEIFNIGSEWNPTIMDIAKLIKLRCYKLFNFSPKVITSFPIEEPEKLIYSVDKLRKYGFKSNYLLDDLDDLLKYCINII